MELQKILDSRGINEETASKLGWRVSGDWLEMPVIKGGEEIGFKARKFGDDKAFMQKKGTPQIFYNFDALACLPHEELIVTEGELDCAVALQCGYNAVSVPGGAPMEKVETDGKKYGFLDDLPKLGTVILAFDDDSAGHNLLHDVSVRIGKGRCKWMRYPKGCKDLNETLLKYGAKGVHESVKRSAWVQVDGLSLMSDLPPPAFTEAVDCPVYGMAEYYKLRLGDFTVITGIPGMGKTTFANEVCASIAMTHGWNVCVASFEQNPRADFEPWLQSFYNGKPAHLQTEKQIESANAWINEKFRLITPTDNEDIDLVWLCERIEAAALRHNCKLVVVDPWNELDHIKDQGMSQTDYTGIAIKTLKRLAARLQIHLIIITHPAKMTRNKDGEYPVPSLYDIADSAHWRNKADMGIIVHRDDDKTSRIIVAKCRYWGKIGKTGEVEVKYDDYINKFVSLHNYG
jgi:twinkle protein